MAAEMKVQDKPKNALKIEYDPEVDILTIFLQEPETPLGYSDEDGMGGVLNYAEDGRLSSVEILDASKRYSPQQIAAYSLDEFIDLKKASEISGIAPVTLRTQAEKGKLWAIRLGGRWMTTRDRIKQYIDRYARRKRGSARAD